MVWSHLSSSLTSKPWLPAQGSGRGYRSGRGELALLSSVELGSFLEKSRSDVSDPVAQARLCSTHLCSDQIRVEARGLGFQDSALSPCSLPLPGLETGHCCEDRRNGLWGVAGSPGPTVLQVPGRVGLAPGRGTTDGTLSGKGTLRAALMPLASISASLTSKGPRGLFPEEGKGGQQACVAEPCPVPCGLALALLTVH